MNLTEVREYERSDKEDMEVDHATTRKAGTIERWSVRKVVHR